MRTVYSCVVDTDPKYARQAVLWAASLLVHGEQEAGHWSSTRSARPTRD